MKGLIIIYIFVLFNFLESISCAPTNTDQDHRPVAYRDADIRKALFQPLNFWRPERYKWPQGTLPYVLSPLYTSAERNIVLNAIAEWEAKTCVRFIPRQPHHVDYLEITPDDSTSSYCYSYVGRQGGRQLMKMFGECLRHAAMIHELGHAIAYHYAFDKYSSDQVDNLGTPYDYTSVMQYPYYAFSDGDPNRPAMTLPDGSIDSIRYEAQQLSSMDIYKVNLYYNNCN
ncbi:Zinc metalloproteinase nas-4 [Folsomia candida]|uniref:Metalloendopeptidase n=1 Tax=Folsomia candida TaxID=158441 RepID=A0A226EKC5_FOLCA|nr:Zinc metalloproteinase nas-4 [Folsomia candida]